MPTIGQYTLEGFKIQPIGNDDKATDIKNIVSDFSIVESIDLGYVHGSATIVDTEGFLKKVPMNGEEIITITYSDWFQVRRTEEYFLYSIQHEEQEIDKSDTIQTYTIYFCSIGRLLSSLQLVRVGVNTSASEAAKQLFTDYFVDVNTIGKIKKELKVEDSPGLTRLVIPAYSPIESMHFLTRNAITNPSSNLSSSYRFFENRDKFWFATDDYIIKLNGDELKLNKNVKDTTQRNSYFVIAQSSSEPEEIRRQMFKIIGLKYGTRFNTIKDFDDGIYKRRIFELDVISREIVRTDYSLNDDFGTGITLAGQNFATRHTNPFIENILAEPQDYFVIKDWTTVPSGMRPNPVWSDLVGRKPMHVLHNNSNEIEILVYGRNTVFAGSIVELELPEFKTRQTEIEIDEEKSGVYLVKSVNNEFKNNTYYQTLTLIRPGINTVISETKMTQKIEAKSVEPKCSTEPIYGAGSSNGAGAAGGRMPSPNNMDTSNSAVVDTPAGPQRVAGASNPQYDRLGDSLPAAQPARNPQYDQVVETLPSSASRPQLDTMSSSNPQYNQSAESQGSANPQYGR